MFIKESERVFLAQEYPFGVIPCTLFFRATQSQFLTGALLQGLTVPNLNEFTSQ